MGPVIGMSPDKKAETPGVQELVGSQAATCGMGTLPEAESAASPKATSVDKGLGDDEELTNLNWLHENLLQNFTLGTEAHPSVSPLYDIEGGGAVPASSSSSSSSSCAGGQEKDSLKSKPPYSFSLLIYMAIEQSRNKCLPVKEIYSWILDHFPYFANAPTGWKNSVRHNLSLNKCFRKVERNLGKANGKGSLWCVDPEYRPNLIQALKKQHFPAAHAFCTPPASPPSGSSPPRHLILQDQGCSLKESDIDAATAMMLLNSSPEQHRMQCGKPQQSRALPQKRSYSHHRHHHSSSSSRMPGVQDNPIDLSRPETAVVSNDPKEDHNYSATFQHCASRSSVSRSSVSSLSSVDEAYEYTPQARRAGSEGFHSDEDSDLAEELEQAKDRLGDSGYGTQQRAAKGPAGKKPRKEVKQEIDEELKEAAGSLLHLAGIRTCLDASRRTAKSKSKRQSKK
ncbi:forkhead box protein N2b isoform X1 [Acipenser oxyrinchus oxyrinchus]|uniref:Forkhead box protein N3 n=1 Tax=Acipenser oxyrinchus oxyrinchus TaxID=40147 RepID=A0AAD8GB59_ACIOX|nr:forkhead box protein N2b isoform X1 [Acipenser oxyrinchus oxyrinchus]